MEFKFHTTGDDKLHPKQRVIEVSESNVQIVKEEFTIESLEQDIQNIEAQIIRFQTIKEEKETKLANVKEALRI